MRRTLSGLLAFVGFTSVLVVLPVYAAPSPEAEPVTTSDQSIELGSVEEPTEEAEVQQGTTEPVDGVPSTSPTLTLDREDVAEFSLVGVTWADDPAVTDTVVQVRARSVDDVWGDWTEVSMEDADQDEDADTGAATRGGTSPLWTGPSNGVQVELVTRSGSAPTDVDLELVDPGQSDADTSLGTPEIQDTADAALSMPDVFSRAQWGADESIRTWAPSYAPTIRAATLHHTADTNDYMAADVPAMLRSIYRYHAVSRGWGDIGYNVVVDKYGRLWEGRYGGLASTVVGAHAGGFNTGTFGVSMLGNYDSAAAPQAMVESVASVIAWKFSLYGVDPNAWVDLTSSGGGTSRYASGVVVTLPTIFGHRDVGATSCPGQYGYARLPEIRRRVTTLLAANESQIATRYYGDGAARALLGGPTGTETRSGDDWQQRYDRGYITWSQDLGAHVVQGAVAGTFAALGGVRSLGAALTDEQGLPDGSGRVSYFRNGAVYWSPASGTGMVTGAVRQAWVATGAEAGSLGYPVSSELALPDGRGRKSEFQSGIVLWSPSTGAWPVQGAIAAAYASVGLEGGSLGYPVGPEVAAGTGRSQQFQGGSVFWSSATGAHVVWGAVAARWTASGGVAGGLGFPVAAERPVAAGQGVTQEFQGGTVTWSARTGAQVVAGGIRSRWSSDGGAGGFLGLPRSDEAAGQQPGVRVQQFTGGRVVWTAASGAWSVGGGIGAVYERTGGDAGSLGPPTNAEAAAGRAGARYQVFARGDVYWSAGTGSHWLPADVRSVYGSAGGAAGGLGLPVSDPYSQGGIMRVDFQHGWVTYGAGGAVVHRG